MFRTMYDTDVTVWSPQGRLLQVEYAMEAVKQGSACLGIVGSKYVVLAALKRSPHDLAAYQKKLLKIDDHVGVAIAGLNADARTLAKYMRTECLNHKYVFGAPLQASRLLSDVADKHQRCTQTYVRRPYGVGFLVASTHRPLWPCTCGKSDNRQSNHGHGCIYIVRFAVPGMNHAKEHIECKTDYRKPRVK